MSKVETNGYLTEWERESRSPIIFRSAKGAMAEDVDGKIYLDLTSCSGASPFGSRDPAFTARFAEAMVNETDILPSPVGEQRQKLALNVLEQFPNHDRVFFLRTGSCATEAAVRIARYTTKRPVILTSGFHGWHDVFQQPPWSQNAPALEPNIQDFQYDIGLLKKQLAQHKSQVAAVFFTPEPSIFAPELLQEVARLAHTAGALLIVDEVMCGLRYTKGGYCRAHNIPADLITLAKGLAQGVGLSAVVGTEAAMVGANIAYLGNTYLRENRAFVAANITQDIFKEALVPTLLEDRGHALKRLFESAFKRHGISALVLGKETMFDIILPSKTHGKAFAQACVNSGIYVGYPATYMCNVAMNVEFFNALHASLDRCLTAYKKAVNFKDQVTDVSVIGYCKEAFCATEEACLSNKYHWTTKQEMNYERPSFERERELPQRVGST